jgi:hypothetical protein
MVYQHPNETMEQLDFMVSAALLSVKHYLSKA